ncbi:MAG: hypothetical protein C0525_12300 [Flavobacterium sp.]|uniref:hypothetical protein n=1 Tax=unclassified Flavobacterium TaxID=196869 RepID=UPI000EB4EBDB|nr:MULTISPECIES: hypothetical protein [unclassified Flavobacterium]MBA4135498.1 hypothetical protein [Flavobacterium sp.]RKS03569.1 hypothetical protein C8C84_3330 [Flavobacterium sp. 102]
MSKVIIDPEYLKQLAALDADIRALNAEKIKLLFTALDISLTDADFERLMEWELVLVTVPDKQMAVQLNKHAAYIPNLKFTVDETQPIFTLMQGSKTRRVWKER